MFKNLTKTLIEAPKEKIMFFLHAASLSDLMVNVLSSDVDDKSPLCKHSMTLKHLLSVQHIRMVSDILAMVNENVVNLFIFLGIVYLCYLNHTFAVPLQIFKINIHLAYMFYCLF